MLQKDLRNTWKKLKNELDKMAVKLNYIKLDLGVIMQKNIPKDF